MAAGVTCAVWLAGCTVAPAAPAATHGIPSPTPSAASAAPVVSPGGSNPTGTPSVFGSSPSGLAVSPSSGSSADVSVAALLVYRRYWAARVAAQADPAGPVPEALSSVAVDRALAAVESADVSYAQDGVAVRGMPVLDPRVTGVQLTTPPTVDIADCVDVSRWVPVYVATGASAAAPGQPTRVLVQSTATVYAGRWVIRYATVERGRTC